MRRIAGEFEADDAAGLVGRQFQRFDLGGNGDTHADERGFLGDFAQLVMRTESLGDEQPVGMAVIAAAQMLHGADGQDAHRDAMLVLQPFLQRAGEVVTRIEQLDEGFRFFLDAGEMVGALFEHVADFINRQTCAGRCRLVAFARKKIRQIGQARLAFAIGAMQLENGGGDIGRRVAQLDKLLVAGQFARHQRVGKDFAQLRQKRFIVALQLFEIDLEGGGELQDELHRQRTLIALDEVEIGWRDAQFRRHGGLGQFHLMSDAPDSRAGKNLLFGHGSPLATEDFTNPTSLQAKFVTISTSRREF